MNEWCTDGCGGHTIIIASYVGFLLGISFQGCLSPNQYISFISNGCEKRGPT